MLTNGFAGYPMLSGIPRGETFVRYMTSTTSTTAITSGTAPSALTKQEAPSGPKPGGFDQNASSEITAKETTPLADGSEQMDFTRTYSDGSVRDATRTTFPDGSGKETAIRRSLPDADGNQMVRVIDINIDPDGTRNVDVRIFKVPAGTTLDWNSAEAQAYFVGTQTKIIPPGLTWRDVPGEAPATEQENTAAKQPPSIPLSV